MTWCWCRSLGVHISKVRSINLDAWELDLVKVMAELGNTVVNQIYEANVDETLAARPNASSNRSLQCSTIFFVFSCSCIWLLPGLIDLLTVIDILTD